MTVLLTRFSALGDVALTVPVVYSACRCYPDTRFVFITRPSMTSIFVNPPLNLTVVGVDLAGEYKGVGGLRRLSARIVREYRPDIYVDLHNVLRTRVIALFLRMSGVPSVRLVKPRRRRKELTRRYHKVMLPLMSQLDRYREVFAAADMPLTERFDGLYGGRDKAPEADFAAITGPKPQGECWVGIAPFAAHGGKIYPPELMEQVLARLQADADAGRHMRIFLFGGGAHEQEVLERWAGKYPCATSLAGKRYGFPAELALFNHLDAVVSMDSANMHLAAIAGAPTISIWGATHPYCGFRGWRQSDDDTIQLPIECRPCSVFGDKPCYRGDHLCMNAIKPDLIYSRLMKKIGAGA